MIYTKNIALHIKKPMNKTSALLLSALFSLMPSEASNSPKRSPRKTSKKAQKKLSTSRNSRELKSKERKSVVKKSSKHKKSSRRHKKQNISFGSNPFCSQSGATPMSTTPRNDESFNSPLSQTMLQEASKTLQDFYKTDMEQKDKTIETLSLKFNDLENKLVELLEKSRVFLAKQDFLNYTQRTDQNIVNLDNKSTEILQGLKVMIKDLGCCCNTNDSEEKIKKDLDLQSYARASDDSLWVSRSKDMGYSSSLVTYVENLGKKIQENKKTAERRTLRKEQVKAQEVLENRNYVRFTCGEKDLITILKVNPALEDAFAKNFEELTKNQSEEERQKLPKDKTQQAVALLAQSISGIFDATALLFLMGIDGDNQQVIRSFGDAYNKDTAMNKYLLPLEEADKTPEKKAEIQQKLEGIFGCWAKADVASKNYQELVNDIQDALLLMGSAKLAVEVNQDKKVQRILVAPYEFTKFVASEAPDAEEKSLGSFFPGVVIPEEKIQEVA